MSVVAIVRGASDYNLLVADAESKQQGERALRDKIVLLYGNTYATALGEGGALYAAQFLLSWYEPDRRPDLRSPRWCDAVLTLMEREREIRRRLGEATNHTPIGLKFVVCSRETAFYWESVFETEHGRYTRPESVTVLKEGEAILFWGGDTVVSYPDFKPTPADPFKPMLTAIKASEARLREEGNTSISYELGDRFSGVALPHRKGRVLRRRPFTSPVEEFLHLQGPRGATLASDEALASFVMPAAQ